MRCDPLNMRLPSGGCQDTTDGPGKWQPEVGQVEGVEMQTPLTILDSHDVMHISQGK